MVKELIIIAAGVSVVVTFAAVIRYKMSQMDSDEEVERIFVDELNVGEIKSWFVDKLFDEKQKGIVFYPTKETEKKWNIKMPENKNQLIQIVYNVETEKVVEYREIIFGELSSKLKELLDSNGGTLVIEK